MFTQLITNLSKHNLLTQYEIDNCFDNTSTLLGKILTGIESEEYITPLWQTYKKDGNYSGLYITIFIKEINCFLINKIEKEMELRKIEEYFVNTFIQNLLDYYSGGELMIDLETDLQYFLNTEKNNIDFKVNDIIKTNEIIKIYSYNLN